MLGDLAFLVLCLARGTLPLRCSLVRLKSPHPGEAPWPEQGGRTSTATTRRQKGQPVKKNSEKNNATIKANMMHREDSNSQFFIPALGSIRSNRDGGHE
jgi:hypothetical protein